MMRRLLAFLGYVALVVLIVAPVVWAAVEIPWSLFVYFAPQAAAEATHFAGAWLSMPWLVGITAAVFVAAFIGAFFPGPFGTISCAFFFVLGWLLLIVGMYLIADAAGAAVWILLGFFSPAIEAIDATYGWLRDWAIDNFAKAGELAVRMIERVFLIGLLAFQRVREAIAELQEAIQSAIIGDVDGAFPRQSAATAERCAHDRRKAINAFVNTGKSPPRHSELRFTAGATANRFVREYVERRQEVTDAAFERAPEFLEVPRGSRIVAERTCVDGREEVAGQYSRLKLEARPAPARGSDERAVPEETLLLLLARVVDAAVLADRHHDGLREKAAWNALPFFERIYVEYRPLPAPLYCFLRPVTGGALPARVVIETSYPDVFKTVLFGGDKGKRNAYGGWFGIGIKIETPNMPQDPWSNFARWLGAKVEPVKIERQSWFPARVLCRRLKSRVAGVVSGKVRATFKPPPSPANLPPLPDLRLDFHVMPSGPLADGCPSVMSPAGLRGSISNAPPMWLLRPRDNLDEDCKNFCVKAAPAEEEDVSISLAALGTMQEAASELPADLVVPGAKGVKVRRRVWIGAFFNHDLRLGNRFPVAGCALRGGEASWAGKHADLRGAFAKRLDDKDAFAGVFVSTNGPVHASNLLLPAPLLNDFLNYLALTDEVVASLPPCEEPEFVPTPERKRAR